MTFPRITAAICVCLLIGCLALTAIGAVSFFGPLLVHGNEVEHNAGTIVQINADMTFVLKTADGHKIPFQCDNTRCRTQIAHMQRHLFIKAHTDVYYVRGPANMMLLAMDVD